MIDNCNINTLTKNEVSALFIFFDMFIDNHIKLLH